jgi:ribonuclease HI
LVGRESLHESIALLEALKVVENRGFSHVMFETDSMVDAIHHFRGGSSKFSYLISYINNLLSCNPNFKVEFIKRQTNMVAHSLARATISWVIVTVLLRHYLFILPFY